MAIIGMGCLFPKSPGVKDYWRLLFHGEDAIIDVPETHWASEDFFDEDPKKPDHVYCRKGGFISPTAFDPTEFGIPPSSLEATDTSQLLGLITAKKALEDSGYGEKRNFNHDRTSVVLGVTGTQELVIPLGARLGHPIWRRALEDSGIAPEKTEEIVQKISDSYVSWQENSFPGLLGNVVSGRICNRLDLGGTNCVVDAACASSLSAVHLGVMELISRKSDMVITGGVDMLNDIFMHMCFSKTMVLSPTGDARPFSKDADGTVLGEGIGLFVLKRLEDAERDGDKIYAVIKGVGSSSDGKSQSIYSPRAEGQTKALKMAYDQAGVDPATIELIEAHGTGTIVGDEVEFKALKSLFEKSGKDKKWCALGSVKSMIGHTKAAAGAAGLMKAVLSVYNKALLPTLKVGTPDPKLNIHQSPFYLNTQTRPWFSKKEHPRRSGVSAFGFGGSNFHVLIEEYHKQKQEISWDGSVEIAALSAQKHPELNGLLDRFKTSLGHRPTHEDISVATAKTRKDFSFSAPYRLLLVFEPTTDLTALCHRASHALETHPAQTAWNLGNIFYGGPEPPGKTAFIFPGQGSQYVGMGRDIVCCFPDAFRVLEHANETFENYGCLTDIIYPFPAETETDKQGHQETLRKTNHAQPAIGAVSVAMLKTLQGFGLKPDATCGHSYGEFSALYAAGWIDLDTLLVLSITRGRLMATAGMADHRNNGGMLAVKGPLDELDHLIQTTDTGVILANRNSPDQGVLSGSLAAIARAEKLCKQNGFKTLKLPVSAAFHSSLVQEAQKPFIQALEKIDISPSDIPVFSNTTGEAYPDDPEKAKKLLGDHLLSPVNFINEIKNLYKIGVRTFVEVGPKSVLTGLVKSILNPQSFHAIPLDGSLGKRSGITDLARTVCHLASLGHAVDLSQWESPVEETRKPLMNIPISGVNYRNPATGNTGQKPKVKHRKPEVRAANPEAGKSAMETENLPPNPTSDQPVNIPENRRSCPSEIQKNLNTMKNTPQHAHFISDALKVVHEGLKSMQTIQMQTAEAHQKFLETQTLAAQTLQNMMENTQRLAEASMGIKTEIQTSDFFVERPKTEMPGMNRTPADFSKTVGKLQPSDSQGAMAMAPGSSGESVLSGPNKPAVAFEKLDLTSAGTELKPSDDGREEIGRSLLDIVSRLTGYPMEMLALDMDIEADLGIDSIKRVEILSTLEEKIPGLPPVPPELMGSLKTLDQIVAYLSAAPKSESNSALETKDSGTPVTAHPEIAHSLLDIVSRLTGYPMEMLALDMDIEADLGIDSIKRVEILSTLEEKIPGLPPVPPELMGSLKTLDQIVAYLSAAPKSESNSALETKDSGMSRIDPSDPKTAPTASPNHSDTVKESLDRLPEYDTGFSPEYLAASIGRRVVSIVDSPRVQNKRLTLPATGTVYITDDTTGLSQAIADGFASLNIKTEMISDEIRSDIVNGNLRLENAAGLVIVAGNMPHDHHFLKDAFALTRGMALDLLESGAQDGALFATITRLDGAFGFKGRGMADPLQGGLAGLAKTAALEWENVCCRAIDIAPDWKDTTQIAKAVVAELLNAHGPGPVEVGLDAGARWTLGLEAAPYPQGEIALDPEDVVVITGGARGVTASAACALARHAKPTLILLGRSLHPTPEPEWLAAVHDEAAIKKAILENEFRDNHPTPIQLETAYKKYMSNREIIQSLEKIRKVGANVRYYSVDVRDLDGVSSVLNDVRSEYGPVKAVVHGAGVLNDRRITDKTAEQFDTVFDPKVQGLGVLLEATKKDPLKYLVLFSSVTARIGNKGQADYAMANEALNKIAQQESIQRPDCRVVSINWGPWDGGMVCSALKQKFEKDGVQLIPADAGAMCLVHEMMGDTPSPVEVVIGATIIPEKACKAAQPSGSALEQPVPLNKDKKLFLTFQREIDLDRFPILGAHILDGKPVVPFALIAEWLGHGALHENPGLSLQGLDDMRIFHGIILEQEKKRIRLMAGKARKNGSIFEVDVEIRNGIKDGVEMIHSGATAILTDQLVPPPHFNASNHIGLNSYSRSIDEIYEKILFHGIELRGIREIVGYSSQSISARIASAPSPARWMTDPLRSRWIADPLVFDCACQMAIIWCFEERGMVSLPSYSASYRQYRDRFPSEGVTAVLEVKEATDHIMTGDFTFLDADNVVVATLTGYEAVMDASLSRAFKSECAA